MTRSFPKSLQLISWNTICFARFVLDLFVVLCQWWEGWSIWVWNRFYKSLVLQRIFLNHDDLSLGINIWIRNPLYPQILCVFCDASLVIELRVEVCLSSILQSQSLMPSKFLINACEWNCWISWIYILPWFYSCKLSELLKVDKVKLSLTFFYVMLYKVTFSSKI